jgi:uncharacterized surface protein with fasciclin (FAS1) repeats
MRNIGDLVSDKRDYNEFFEIVEKTGHLDTLSECGTFTVLIPTNEAFEKWKKIKEDKRMERKDWLKILKNHVLRGRYESEDMRALKNVKTMAGTLLEVFDKKGLRLNYARVVQGDIRCKNGLIHRIDRVLG